MTFKNFEQRTLAWGSGEGQISKSRDRPKDVSLSSEYTVNFFLGYIYIYITNSIFNTFKKKKNYSIRRLLSRFNPDRCLSIASGTE